MSFIKRLLWLTKWSSSVLLSSMLLAIGSSGCSNSDSTSPDQPTHSPQVDIMGMTHIAGDSATAKVTVTDEGSSTITEHGICWSTSGSPTIKDSISQKVVKKQGSTYWIQLIGLQEGTTYYVRAYATNKAGKTGYSHMLRFKTKKPAESPQVQIIKMTRIDGVRSAEVKITDDGGFSLMERGICWSTSEMPTVEASPSQTMLKRQGQTYWSQLSGLQKDTTYYVRAYATNQAGKTGYSETLRFKADFSSGAQVMDPVAANGNDPWVIKQGNRYYYCYAHNGAIWVNSSKRLADAVQSEGNMVWRPQKGNPYSKDLWAPELHYINNKWYIYVAADDGQNANHRMYALVAKTSNPLSKFRVSGKVAGPMNKWAIDGTVMRYKGERYFIWSGWKSETNNTRQNLYIAKMSGPTTISSHRVMISTPRYDWEKVGSPIEEGPEALKNAAGDAFIIYSASGSWTNSYCLGQLKLVGDDPLDKDSWKKKAAPAFESTDEVFSPGHASFTKSADGTEDWIVYHTAKYKGAGWNRDVNIKKFTWDDKGNPVFGKPITKGIKFAPPSRE